MSNVEWFVYIARARTGRYYTGITTNPEKRIEKHNDGRGSHLAMKEGPFELVWVSPPFSNKSEARKRGVQIKKWSRKKKEKLIKGEWE